MGTTHLLAYVSDGESAASIRALMHRQNIQNFAVEPGNAVEATEYLKSHASPQTLIVEVPTSDDAPRMLDALADVVHPATRVIVTGKVDTFSFYHWLMGLGIHDYLLSPFNEQQLASALQKLSPAAAKAAEETPTQKKLITVIGVRGGVGATTLATALASIFAQEQQISTALVDTDTHFGTVALGLDLEPSRGMRDALEKPERIDSLFLERVMLKPSPQLSILSAEEPISELIAAQANAGETLLNALREKFPLVIVDLPHQVTPLARYLLDHSDHVVLVAEPSILSLRDALRWKDYIVDVLKRPAPHMVVNREGLAGKQELPRAEFAKHVGMSPALHLPFLTEVIAATARGETLLSDTKLSAIAGPLRQFATQLSGKEAVEKSTGGRTIGMLLKGKK